jgi:predicted 2-oxoglutarate/Fe(II)-dependent dioxygenase YbiX
MIDQNLAEMLFRRIKPLLPETYRGFKILYLNSHFRFSKYNAGGQFPIHRDGTNLDKDRLETYGMTQSMFTLNIFLNDDFIGGETEFFTQRKGQIASRYVAKPKAGRAALFYANQLHRGNMVHTPYKYLLRTDVMVGAHG